MPRDWLARVLPPQFFRAASCPAVSLAALLPQAVSLRWVSHPRVSRVASHRAVWRPSVLPRLALNHWVFDRWVWNPAAAFSAALVGLCHLWSRPLFQQVIFVFQFCVHPQAEQPRLDLQLLEFLEAQEKLALAEAQQLALCPALVQVARSLLARARLELLAHPLERPRLRWREFAREEFAEWAGEFAVGPALVVALA